MLAAWREPAAALIRTEAYHAARASSYFPRARSRLAPPYDNQSQTETLPPLPVPAAAARRAVQRAPDLVGQRPAAAPARLMPDLRSDAAFCPTAPPAALRTDDPLQAGQPDRAAATRPHAPTPGRLAAAPLVVGMLTAEPVTESTLAAGHCAAAESARQHPPLPLPPRARAADQKNYRRRPLPGPAIAAGARRT